MEQTMRAAGDMPLEPSFASPSGSTRLFAVIGDPVTQVQAPALFNRLLAQRQVDAVLVPVEISRDNLSHVMEGLKRIGNLDGIFVTVPHKIAVLDFLDHRSTMVDVAGSANAIRRETDGSWSGDNFDGRGFVAGLIANNHDPAGKIVSLIGAGGAGVSIAAALLEAGVARLLLTDVDQGRAEHLAARLDASWPGKTQVKASAELDETDIVVNATPVGLRPSDPLPFPIDALRPQAVVADIIMKPPETRLLAAAAQRGLRTHPGIHMLTEQIELYWQFFRLPAPPSKPER